jgi:scyllo-inositol 2-dehydrogenase (NADP+)
MQEILSFKSDSCKNEEVDDYFKILFKFENGIMGEIELGTYFLADKEKWFERHWLIGGNKRSMYSDAFEPVGKIARTSRLLTNVSEKTTMTASGLHNQEFLALRICQKLM